MSCKGFALIAVLALLTTQSYAQDCKWSINLDLPEFQPLYIKPNGSLNINGFWLPQSGDVVTVPQGQQVLFACPGRTLNPVGGSEATLTCSSGKWSNGITSYTFSQITCSNYPSHKARYTGTACNITGPYSLIEAGFELMNGKFYKIMEYCFDKATSDSIYSLYLQTPQIKGLQTGFPRPGFLQGSGFYPTGMSVDTLYTFNSQLAAVTAAVGSASLAAQYCQEGTDFYMSRGHLTAKADFVYGSHQRVTFWFMNVAPQWQTFNAANWAILEDNVRTYAETYSNSLYVYTGTHGTTTLEDVNGNQVPIYLKKDANGKGLLKNPHIFWKVVFDAVTGKGIAFAGLNNPHIDSPGLDFYVCEDVCDQVTWLTWSPNDQVAGYSYCCEVPAMADVFPEIPKLPITGLLT